jgi:protein-L-isoaspartate(D-aspartate) O-methyltransferase
MAARTDRYTMSAGDAGGMVSERVRARMVERVREHGVRDPRVLDAMARVPRHLFVDTALSSRAYEDTALPIGHGQTISQPYIVARTIELALAGVADARTIKVLEVGTGCGYAAAVFAQLAGQVYSIERVRALHELARSNLRALRLPNLHLVFGDGFAGLAAQAPFDAIVVAAAGADLPPAWLEQLSPTGVIVAPLGGSDLQRMVVVRRDAEGQILRKPEEEVRFVPLRTGVQ